MFKRITIKLSAPICKCKIEDLCWDTPSGGLRIKCNTCGVSLDIPNKVFVANFDFDEPYPETKVVKEPAKILSIVKATDEQANPTN